MKQLTGFNFFVWFQQKKGKFSKWCMLKNCFSVGIGLEKKTLMTIADKLLHMYLKILYISITFTASSFPYNFLENG